MVINTSQCTKLSDNHISLPLSDKGDIIQDHITRVQIPGVIQFDANTGDSMVSRYDVFNYRPPGSASGGFCRPNAHCYTTVSVNNISMSLFIRGTPLF